ncbi:SAM-dependent methyltransferase [Longispora albida]|uniref:SAM-dependent methyltransferase n=1 Tax=Longispora albida TaxID=203523 RepID=UPI000368F37B|nr:class I SAM-dependent methyltransferase [Longispora albida]
MTDEDLKPYFAAAAANLVYNAPVSPERVEDLISRLTPDAPDWRALDLGCGNGEFLIRLCKEHGIPGAGVEIFPADREVALKRAAELKAEDLLAFHTADATTWTEPANLVVNVGAGHIWGSTASALTALHKLTAPGGMLLFADGFYEKEPSEQVREMFGDLPDLNGFAAAAVAAGFRVLYLGQSTLDEWDAFESDWRAGIEYLESPGGRAFADKRREEYLTGYRGVVGFAWSILTPA